MARLQSWDASEGRREGTGKRSMDRLDLRREQCCELYINVAVQNPRFMDNPRRGYDRSSSEIVRQRFLLYSRYSESLARRFTRKLVERSIYDQTVIANFSEIFSSNFLPDIFYLYNMIPICANFRCFILVNLYINIFHIYMYKK